MEVYLIAFGISLATVLIVLLLFKTKITWWEPAMIVAVTIGFALLFQNGAKSSLTKDVEYWGDTKMKATYYEYWNEYIHQTCTETCCCDKDGMNCVTTVYDCSYVQHHSPYWTITGKSGKSYHITESEFKRIQHKFKNKTFVDMHRHYHTKDGDAYVTTWPGDEFTYEAITTKHSYKNKVQVAPSVFEFVEVDSADIVDYGLYDYPKVTKLYYQKAILGGEGFDKLQTAERKAQILNGTLGPTKEVRLFFLIFKNKTRQAADYQESYWKGGNKNEFVVCIGLDNDNNIDWVKPFSWTESAKSQILTRDLILALDEFNLSDIVEITGDVVKKYYVRKNFSDFDYLDIELTSKQYLWLVIICLILNFGLAIFAVFNPFERK